MDPLPVLIADENGEQKLNIKYMPGSPRQIRFDAKAGKFNVAGKDELGTSLTFQPIAWEFFTADILNMGLKSWVELFYLDEKNRVCAILFHGYSVDALKAINNPLFYDDLTLGDVVLTVTAEQRENTKIKPKGIYYIASFEYTMGDPQRTHDLKGIAPTIDIYRTETLHHTRVATITEGYRVPQPEIDRIFGLNSSKLVGLPAAS